MFSQVDGKRFEDTLPFDVDISSLQRQVIRVTIVKPAKCYIYSLVTKSDVHGVAMNSGFMQSEIRFDLKK